MGSTKASFRYRLHKLSHAREPASDARLGADVTLKTVEKVEMPTNRFTFPSHWALGDVAHGAP